MSVTNSFRSHLTSLTCGLFLLVASVHSMAQDSSTDSDFPAIYNSEPSQARPMDAAAAAAQLKLPDGFKATLFASEPAVQNPIGMTWDTHGRLWVAENYTYAERGKGFDRALRDRIVILEDKDGDGNAEHRTVFADNLQILTSVEVGQGGVWLMCPPNLLFVPDADGDGKPDGPASVVLDGFDVGPDSYHNFANGLKWGPDGWLYGRVGHSCPGKVGAPGTSNKERIPIDGGIWRFSPKSGVFEALCHGTVNPWGHDWDADGELFFVNTVIGHLWHMVPGAHFIESFGESSNPRIYERLDMIADHYHFDVNGSWTESRDGKANDFGGGHAHTGAAICLDPRWPESYRGKLFTINMHGLRANMERLERLGSGYVGKHEPDLFISPDPFFRGIDLNFGPDGALYVSDWSDTGECHDSTGVHRTSGRIYRIEPPGLPSGGASLIRRPEGTPSGKPICLAGEGVLPKLWADYQSGRLGHEDLLKTLRSEDEHHRVWAIRLLSDRWPLDTIMGPLANASYPTECEELVELWKELAKSEPSGLVLSAYASVLQRLPANLRIGLANSLIARKEFAEDPRLQNLVWYGLAPTVESHSNELIGLIAGTKWHKLQQHIARSIAENGERKPRAIHVLLAQAQALERPSVDAILQGLWLGFQGRKRVEIGDAWPRFSEEIATRSNDALRRRLDAYMGSGHAIQDLLAEVQNSQLEMKVRQQALETILQSEYAEAEQLCLKLLDVRILNATAVQGLARFNSTVVGKRIAQKYRQFQPEDRRAVLDLLCTRPSFAEALLEALASTPSPIPISDIKPQHALQIQALGIPDLSEKLSQVWGETRNTLPTHQQRIDRLKKDLASRSESAVDLAQGRKLFEDNCSQCHRLYGLGSAIGPDLTGTQRSELDYLLLNIVDPGASVGKDYRATLVRTLDGRTLSGLVIRENEDQLILQVGNTQQIVNKDEIDERKQTELSAMPEGLLDSLTTDQIRSLLGYLQHPTQVLSPPKSR